jgi:phosphoglycolate phosphatase
MLLVLFDIDGTLISTRGAGMRAFYRALDRLFHVQVSDGMIHPDGKTDPLILKELLSYSGLSDHWCTQTRQDLFSLYLEYLEEEMSRARTDGMIRILPGVKELLDKLVDEPDFCTGLVTGNLERGASIKLKHAGLQEYFKFGGYGSDSEDRTEVTRTGIQRGIQYIAPHPMEGAFVIGDTPLDIHHGKRAGAGTIAVASAKYSLQELASNNPGLLVADLTAISHIISYMRSARPEGAAASQASC